jgi:uncharacterized protein (DUF2384 family)
MAAIAPFIEQPHLLEDRFGDRLTAPILDDPRSIEAAIAERNLQLAREPVISDDLRLFVAELADGFDLPEGASLRVDPYHLLSAQRALIGALRALDSDDAASARRQLRARLEQMRQVYRDIAEGGPLYEDDSAKDVARWLSEVLDAPQARLAELFGVSARTFQRWISESDPVGPEGDDARRLRIVGRLVNHLRHVLTGPGVLRWLESPHPRLDGERPLDLLDDPEAPSRLSALAASARSHSAA